MGVNTQALQLLLVSKKLGVKLDSTITIGRLDLLMTPQQICNVCRSFSITIDEREAHHIAFDADRFSELLFKRLGAAKVDSLDASGFEGATIVHDLNQPLPSGVIGQYSLVFDGGTIEHVFNFPTAIRNCMELPCLNGHLMITSPANNQMGHGFYQFGPDLFYRVLSPENGYVLKALFLVPAYVEGDWYRVTDPAKVHARIGYNESRVALSLCAIAQRVELVPMFSRPPQQQDYAAEWENQPGKGLNSSRLSWFDEVTERVERDRMRLRRTKRVLRAFAPRVVRDYAKAWQVARQSLTPPDPTHFERFDLPRM